MRALVLVLMLGTALGACASATPQSVDEARDNLRSSQRPPAGGR